MPIYDYRCDSCDHEINDLYQSILEETITLCPGCGNHTLHRIIYGGIATFVKHTNTIGQIADKNWKNMGSYKRSEIEQKNKEQAKSKESPLSSFGPASRKQINKMTQEQKKKYIMEGEV